MLNIRNHRLIEHILFYGQSLSVGYNANGALSTACPGFHRTFNGGPYAFEEGSTDSLKWLVESGVETPCSGAASYLAQKRRWDRKLFSTIGKSGWTIELLQKGSDWYDNLLNHLQRGYELITDLDHWYELEAIVFIQGFSNQCVYFNTQEDYLQKLKQLRVDIQNDVFAISGYQKTIPMFIYQLSVGMSADPPRRNVTLAQLEAHETDPNIYITHAGYVPRRSDWIHMTNCGSRMKGHYIGRAIWNVANTGTWEPLSPKTVVGAGSEIVLTLNVPEPPITIDTDWISEVADYGFAIEDDSGLRTITDVNVTDVDEITIDISGSLDTNPRLRHGLDDRGIDSDLGGTSYRGAEGNIHDSSADIYRTSKGEELNLYNWLLHFDKPIT